VRVGIQTWGSEGDIRPFVALGAALARRGHDVELVYTEVGDRRYDAVAAALGFRARAVATPIVDPDRAIEIGLKILNTRNQLEQGVIIFKSMLDPVIEPMFEAAKELCGRSDILGHHFILHASRAAADLANLPSVTVQFAHLMTPSRHIHPQSTPKLGQIGNAIEWRLARFALNRTLLKDVNRLRRRVGLAPFADLLLDAWPSHRLNLLASSPALIDRPPDWPAWHQLCGFLELPPHQHESLAPELDAFLSNGPAPVFMGFGSLMPIAGNMHHTQTIATFESAARIAGCRAIVQGEIERPWTDQIFYVKRTPHRLVFPRCAAVVHHAGAGTTHATLRAGVPSVAVPHVSDQFAWSDELQRLGVAAKALRRTHLTAEALAARIRKVLASPQMKQNAIAIAARMKPDNGPETAADLIEKVKSARTDIVA
jgi:UDP:flavonoid glycosyltransferase YjiC (YdhE family)